MGKYVNGRYLSGSLVISRRNFSLIYLIFHCFSLLLLPQKGSCIQLYFPNGSISVLPVQGRQQGIILKRIQMPKVKTNSSAKKRFKVTGTGKITHQKSFKRHILTKKSKKRKRNMRMDGEVAQSHVHFVKRLLRLK